MHVRRTLAAAALVPLLLAGCQDDPEPIIPEPTASETPTPTESPSESEVAEEESAEEFIRRWQAAADEMQVTGKSQQFLSMGRCKACLTFAETVNEVYANGGSVEATPTEIRAVEVVARDPVTLNLSTRSEPSIVRDADGDEVNRYPGGIQTLRITLEGEPGRWRVSHFAVM